MTRALSTRSSKKKAVSSQDVVPEDCKENSPLILSQSKGLRPKKTLARNERRPRTIKPPEYCKENSPLILSQSKGLRPKKTLARNEGSQRTIKSTSIDMKENIPPVVGKTVNPRRKVSGIKINENQQPCEKVLCDRTNSSNRPIRNDPVSSLSKTTERNQSKLENKENSEKEIKEPHIPVYKALVSSDIPEKNKICSEENDDVYEFEVDENEEPVKVKKRKRKNTVKSKTSKTGAKAFTINNIKYSSTESLVSLPEKPTIQRKKITRRPVGLVNNVKSKPLDGQTNNNNVKCLNNPKFDVSSKNISSVNSTTDVLYKSVEKRPALDLSVLMEVSESKICESSVSNKTSNISLSSSVMRAPPTINYSTSNHSSHHNSFRPPSTNEIRSPHSSISSSHTRFSQIPVFNGDQQVFKPAERTVSKVSSNEVTSHSVNTSLAPSLDFLSSTPIKRTSHVVQNNSVFDQSFDHSVERQTSSRSLISNCDQVNQANDDLFGFTETEELDRPMLSPIKHVPDRIVRRKKAAPPMTVSVNEAKPQPSVQEVIEMLKASIPKRTKQKEIMESFNNSLNEKDTSMDEAQVDTNFKKPPRRSYERQKRVHYRNEDEEEEEEEEEEKEEEEARKKRTQQQKKTLPEKPKPICKPYKRNAAKASAANKTKQQKMTKEELLVERLAAQMNAQFQAVEQVSLVVE